MCLGQGSDCGSWAKSGPLLVFVNIYQNSVVPICLCCLELISLCTEELCSYPTINAEEAEVEHFNEDLQDLLELTPKKRPFHHRGLECKTRKLRDTCSNRQLEYKVKQGKG